MTPGAGGGICDGELDRFCGVLGWTTGFYIARNTLWPCDRGAFAASLISPYARATACGAGQARH